MKKKILVTGGAGFIGSNFCNRHAAKYDVVALDNLLLGDRKNLDSKVHFIEGDACVSSDLDKAGPVDIVVHFAGSSSAPMFSGNGFAESYKNSIDSFVTVLDWAQNNDITKVLYASTSSLYGNNPLPLVETQTVTPQNHYAVTKHVYEECARCFCAIHKDIDVIGFRFMSVYGPNEEGKGKYANIISQFIWDIVRGKTPIIYGDGTQFRDFTHVSDIVEAITLVMESKERRGADVFNIGTGISCTLNDITDAINAAVVTPVPAQYIENPVKEVYIHGQCADISKLVEYVGFSPKTSLKDGIADQVRSVRLDRIRETSSDVLRKG